jgi:membrane protein insertase Oxa1/YidC/SpoIIIJ
MKKYKNDFQKQTSALTEIYQKENYNPFKTLLIQFLPLPILFSVFFVLQSLSQGNYNLNFLNLINLKENNLLLFLIMALLQLATIFNLPQDQRKSSLFFFGMIVLVLARFPAIFNLYWLTNLFLSLLQRHIFKIYFKNTTTS